MKISRSAIAVALLWALTPALAIAQGGHGQGSKPGQGQGQAQPRRPDDPQRGGDMDRDRDRLRILATEQQRDQFHSCTQSQDRVRTHAKEMLQQIKKGATVDETRAQRNNLRNEIRAMQQEHDRVMQGLSPEQRTAAHERIQRMEQVRQRLEEHLGHLDREVDANPYQTAQVEEHARHVERTMNEWQKEHRKFGQAIGVPAPRA